MVNHSVAPAVGALVLMLVRCGGESVDRATTSAALRRRQHPELPAPR
jgi:hypothetical protein